MTDPFFFGYGSLVNRATHDYPHATRATLGGWRRVWKRTALRKVAFLSVEPAPGEAVEGLIASVPEGDWAALDLRERGYARHVAADISHDQPPIPDIQVYAVSAGQDPDQFAEHPILLSYVDTVAQGFLREYGETGLQRFFESTHGWRQTPIYDDRSDPIYPRHQSSGPAERRLVDQWLMLVGCPRTTQRP